MTKLIFFLFIFFKIRPHCCGLNNSSDKSFCAGDLEAFVKASRRLRDGSAHRNGERLFIDTGRRWRGAARFADEFILIPSELHQNIEPPQS